MALHTHPFNLRQGKRRPPGGDGVVYLPFMYRLLLLGYNNKKKGENLYTAASVP